MSADNAPKLPSLWADNLSGGGAVGTRAHPAFLLLHLCAVGLKEAVSCPPLLPLLPSIAAGLASPERLGYAGPPYPRTGLPPARPQPGSDASADQRSRTPRQWHPGKPKYKAATPIRPARSGRARQRG